MLKIGTWIKYCGEVMQVIYNNGCHYYCDDHTQENPSKEFDLIYIDTEMPYECPNDFETPTKREVKYKVKMWRLLYDD